MTEDRTDEAAGGGAAAGGLGVVSLDDFAAADVEGPLAGSATVHNVRLGRLYEKAAKTAREKGAEPEARVYQLLAEVMQIHFKPHDRAEPYGPMWTMEGRRSVIPDDLRGEQSAIFAELAPALKNPGLRARLADIASFNDRKSAAAARLAMSSLCEAVQLVADGKAELYQEKQGADSPNAVDYLRRACQIANATGWKGPEAGTLKALIVSITQKAFESGGNLLNVGELNADYRISDAAELASQATALAGADRVHPETARHLWELAARAHRQAGSESESNTCLVNAAECHVTMAESESFRGMAASSRLMDAIKELRHVPGTKDRRQELEVKLREAQASVADEMGVISTEIDLSDLADSARKAVGELTLAQSFAAFARLDASPPPEKLREEAIKQAEESPISSIIPMSIHDEEGKVVTTSPGLMGDGESAEIAMKHLIARNEGLRRQVTAAGLIEPARRTIVIQHPLETRHFMPLAEMSPFVPAGHEAIFALGFARFFGGDFISAVHLLVPQLENSLRHILKQAGIDPSAIHSDMTQENRTLSVMLEKDRAALEKILGPGITLDIENLFDFRGGPGLRHDLAHGLLSAAACQGHDAIYACWLIFRICFLPLLAHWEDVTAVYAEM